MKSADTIGNPCSTSILELRTKMYTSQTRPSQDFYQGLGAPQYFDLCRLYYYPRQIAQSTICASAFGRLPLHPYSSRAVKSFQHHRRKYASLYTTPSISASMNCNAHRVNAAHCTTPAYKVSTTTMNLLHFLPASHRHHSSARSQL
jgi:hypothetical protein